MSSKTLILSTFLVAFFLSNGCIAKKGLIDSSKSSDVTDKAFLESVEAKNISNNSFYIRKALVTYKDSVNKQSFSVSIKHNENDQYLAIVRSIAGIEIYRLFLSEDTLLINDRLNRRLLIGSESHLTRKIGLSFDSLVLLFGDFFMTQGMESDESGCVSGVRKFKDYAGLIPLDVEVSCSLKKVTYAQFALNKSNFSGEIKFNEFKQVKSLTYPRSVYFYSDNSGMEIEFQILGIESPWNETLEFIPGNNYVLQVLK